MNIWEIKGYKGFNNYDNKDDYNFKEIMMFDREITKEDIEQLLLSKYSKQNRIIILEVSLISACGMTQEVKLTGGE